MLAAVENVFPPIPADTAVAIGAFVSGSGDVTALGVFLVTWVANVAGAAGMYAFARHVGRPFLRSPTGQRVVSPESFARIERLYNRYGAWGIFLSRFIPAARAVVPPFAGVVHLPPMRALVPTAAASAIWYGALTFLVARYVNEIQGIARIVDRLGIWAVVSAVVVGAAIVTFIVLRRRQVK